MESTKDGSISDFISLTAKLGVVLKRTDGSYASKSSNVSPQLTRAVERLGASVAFCMSSGLTEALFEQLTPLGTEIQLDPYGAVLPMVNSIDDLCSNLSSISSQAYMCACRHERFIFIWSAST
jgi:hypothetical protein